MIEYTNKTALSFDDIMLVPQHSEIDSRHNIDLKMIFGKKYKIGLHLPVFAAPMDTVSEFRMALTLPEYGAVAVIHRYMSFEQQLRVAKKLMQNDISGVFAIGTTKEDYEQALRLMDYEPLALVIDTANGHSKQALQAVEDLRVLPAHLMAGNVSTWEGFKRLSDAGADSIRVGIGGGAACTTRTVTGHGIPTLASIMEIAERRTSKDAAIIADGGIRNSGDAVKAFAAGADAVMLGSVLAGHDESPGLVKNGVMEFRGMASEAAQIDRGRLSIVEGISTTVPYKGSVRKTITDFANGIKSGCSYAGVSKLEDLKNEATYVRVSTLSNNETRKKV